MFLSQLNVARSNLLPAEFRQPLENYLKIDLGCVRIHEIETPGGGGMAGVAIGDQICLSPRFSNPASRDGRVVLLHELAHVLQWRAGRAPNTGGLCVDENLEAEAWDLAACLEQAMCGREVIGPLPFWLLPAQLGRRPEARPMLPLHEWNQGKSGAVAGSYKRLSPPSKDAPKQKVAAGRQRFWDPSINDWVDVLNGATAMYLQALKAKNPEAKLLRQRPLSELEQQQAAAAKEQAVLAKAQKQAALELARAEEQARLQLAPLHQQAFGQEEVVAEILSYFSQGDLMRLRAINQLFRRVAERVIWSKCVWIQGFSSLMSAQGETMLSLKQAVMRKLDDVHHARATAFIASDQITKEEYLRHLLGPCVTVKINIGSIDADGLSQSEHWDAVKVQAPKPGGKGHAKFISGGGSVLLNSANYTVAGMEENIESGLEVGSLQVQAYFNRYWRLMRGASPKEKDQFKRLLRAFNSGTQPMRLALAPYIQIAPWLIYELQGASEIVVRMFMIGKLDTADDIITGLNAMGRRGVSIKLYVDWGQYEGKEKENEDDEEVFNFVQDACHRIMEGAPNVEVYQQKRITGKGDRIMHDKLILAKYDPEPTSSGTETRYKVILGSSGFTKNVVLNRNYDFMVAVDEAGLYNYFMDHHKTSLDTRVAKTQVIKLTTV